MCSVIKVGACRRVAAGALRCAGCVPQAGMMREMNGAASREVGVAVSRHAMPAAQYFWMINDLAVKRLMQGERAHGQAQVTGCEGGV